MAFKETIALRCRQKAVTTKKRLNATEKSAGENRRRIVESDIGCTGALILLLSLWLECTENLKLLILICCCRCRRVLMSGDWWNICKILNLGLTKSWSICFTRSFIAAILTLTNNWSIG